MNYNEYLFDGSNRYSENSVKTNEFHGVKDKEEAEKLLKKNTEEINVYADRLLADNRHGLILIIQAMDAAGKDGTIEHVFSGVNPAAVHVAGFREPSADELEHDYLWRIHKEIGPRGQITVLNRSHYEEVLVAKVLDLPKKQNNLPHTALNGIWKKRYKQINDFERILSENGYAVLKINLKLGKEEQARRFLERMDNAKKNYKYAHGDIETRELWKEYSKAYLDCINNTATDYAPWYVIPADRKWYARLVVSEIVLDALKKMKLQYPKLSEEELKLMEEDREKLISGKKG